VKTTRVKRRWTVEHTWTCSACHQTNRGRDLTCSSCGKTKSDENYNERSKTAVADPKLLAIAHGGPNWDCAFCRFENRSGTATCAQCGADKAVMAPHPLYGWLPGGMEAPKYETVDEARARQGLASIPDGARISTAVFPEKPKAEPEIPKIVVPPETKPEKNFWEEMAEKRTEAPPGGYRDAPVKRLDDDPVVVSPRQPLEPDAETTTTLRSDPSTSTAGLRVFAIISAIIAAVALLVWLFSPWHEHVRVSSARWERQRDLHHRVTMHGEGWGAPIGSFNATCESRQHGTHDCNPYDCHPHSVDCRCHQVADGESCHESCTSGQNGFSDCEEVCETEYTEECDACTEYDTCYEQCPTYDDWCRYSYYEWPVVATTRAAGTDHDPVVWPAMDTPTDGETYRIDQAEEYHVAFTNENGTWTTDPSSETAFERYHAGARWDIEVTHAGTVSPVRQEHP